MNGDGLLKALIIIWTVVGIGLSVYLVCFPIFMKKNITLIINLLERIARRLENRQQK